MVPMVTYMKASELPPLEYYGEVPEQWDFDVKSNAWKKPTRAVWASPVVEEWECGCTEEPLKGAGRSHWAEWLTHQVSSDDEDFVGRHRVTWAPEHVEALEVGWWVKVRSHLGDLHLWRGCGVCFLLLGER